MDMITITGIRNELEQSFTYYCDPEQTDTITANATANLTHRGWNVTAVAVQHG